MKSERRVPSANEPWQESGYVGGLVWVLPVAMVVAALLSFVYVMITTSIPIVGHITFVIAFGVAAATAWPMADAAAWFKVRSVPVMRVVGAFVGLFAVYCAWVVFVWMLMQHAASGPVDLLELAASPRGVWMVMAGMNETGTFAVGSVGAVATGVGTTPTGPVLWALWAIEAAIVVGTCVMLAPRRIQDRPFCEDCGVWMATDALFPLVTEATARAVRERGLASIETAATPRLGSDGAWLLRSWRCSHCWTGVFRIDRTFKHTHIDVRIPFLPRLTTQSAEPVVRAAWLRPEDAAELDRIATSCQHTMA